MRISWEELRKLMKRQDQWLTESGSRLKAEREKCCGHYEIARFLSRYV